MSKFSQHLVHQFYPTARHFAEQYAKKFHVDESAILERGWTKFEERMGAAELEPVRNPRAYLNTCIRRSALAAAARDKRHMELLERAYRTHVPENAFQDPYTIAETKDLLRHVLTIEPTETVPRSAPTPHELMAVKAVCVVERDSAVEAYAHSRNATSSSIRKAAMRAIEKLQKLFGGHDRAALWFLLFLIPATILGGASSGTSTVVPGVEHLSRQNRVMLASRQNRLITQILAESGSDWLAATSCWV